MAFGDKDPLLRRCSPVKGLAAPGAGAGAGDASGEAQKVVAVLFLCFSTSSKFPVQMENILWDPGVQERINFAQSQVWPCLPGSWEVTSEPLDVLRDKSIFALPGAWATTDSLCSRVI